MFTLNTSVKATTEVWKLIFTKLINIVPLEQCHHKPTKGMYCGGLLFLGVLAQCSNGGDEVHLPPSAIIKETTPIHPHRFLMELLQRQGLYSLCREKLAYETEFKLRLKLSCNSA